MKRIILSLVFGLAFAIGGSEEGFAEQPSGVKEIFANTILMTPGDCGSLGPNWKRYKPISGRFAVATGEGNDGEKIRAFKLKNEGGKYEHTLTVDEIPAHEHTYDNISTGHTGREVADYGDDQRNSHDKTSSTTKPEGGGKPHNNMPPYLVLNFCHLDSDP